MRTYLVIYPLAFLSILNACDRTTAENAKDKTTDILNVNMTPQQVLEAHLAKHDIFKDANVVEVPDLDIVGYSAFSMTPKSTGRAGEVFYLVKDQEILSSGSNTLDIVMKQLNESNQTLDVHEFAMFFLRFKVVRHGVVLDSHDGHVLMEPNHLPESDFSPPLLTEETDSLNYTFWIFDTDRYIPVFYDIQVGKNGQIEFETKELE